MKISTDRTTRVSSFHLVKYVDRTKKIAEMNRKVTGRTIIESLSLLEPTTSLPTILTLEPLRHLILSSSAFLAMN